MIKTGKMCLFENYYRSTLRYGAETLSQSKGYIRKIKGN
jgi:hypothetical protein